jgi:hypothetical protein
MLFTLVLIFRICVEVHDAAIRLTTRMSNVNVGCVKPRNISDMR